MPVPPLTFPDPSDFAPQILLAAWGLLVLIADIGPLRHASDRFRRAFLGGLTLGGGLVALLLIAAPELVGGHLRGGATTIASGSIAVGPLVDRLNGILIALMLGVVALSTAWDFTARWGEYYALILWSAVGMMLLVAAQELLILFLGLETMTLCLYMATAFEKGRARSAEAGLKYFVYGSVSSALFLFGLSLLYGLAGSTRFEAIATALRLGDGALRGDVAGATALVLILVGFGFKLSAVPFHQWAPDAYEGGPAPVAAWVATGSKIASVAALLNLLRIALAPWAGGPAAPWSPGWVGLLAAIASASMTVGNLAALAQKNFKRLLAYSSIAQGGYILVGVLAAGASTRGASAAGATYYYLVAYACGTLGAFAAATWLARDLGADDVDDLDGLGARSPLLASCLAVLLLSLIGLPPLAGFVGKLAMFAEALNLEKTQGTPLAWLVGLGLLNTVISAVYYVRVIRAMFFRAPRASAPVRRAPAAVWVTILVCTAAVVGLGLRAGPVLDDLTAAAVDADPLPTRHPVDRPAPYLPPEGDPPPRR